MIRYFLRFPPDPSSMTVTTQLLRIYLSLQDISFKQGFARSTYKLKQSMNESESFFTRGRALSMTTLQNVKYILFWRKVWIVFFCYSNGKWCFFSGLTGNCQLRLPSTSWNPSWRECRGAGPTLLYALMPSRSPLSATLVSDKFNLNKYYIKLVNPLSVRIYSLTADSS